MTTNRPVIKRITLEIDDGSSIQIPVDSKAIFFTDEGVNNILAPYYNNSIDWNYTDAVSDIGQDRADAIFNGNSVIQITSQVVTDVWNVEDTRGTKLAFIIKKPACPIAGDV